MADDCETILVSRNKVPGDVVGRLLAPDGRLLKPDDPRNAPHPENLRWHRENIFGQALVGEPRALAVTATLRTANYAAIANALRVLLSPRMGCGSPGEFPAGERAPGARPEPACQNSEPCSGGGLGFEALRGVAGVGGVSGASVGTAVISPSRNSIVSADAARAVFAEVTTSSPLRTTA